MNRPLQALYDLEAQAVQTGWTPSLYREAGNLYDMVNDLTRAVEYWQAAFTLEQSAGRPTSAAELRRLARAYLELQRWPQAIDTLQSLLDVAPGETSAHYELGLILASTDPQAAEAHLRAAAEAGANSAVIEALLRIVQEGRADARLSLRVGLVLGEHALWPQAELAFRYASEAGNPYPEALAYAGLARELQGKDGTEWIERAVALAPGSAQVRYLQGLHLRRRNDYQGSLDALIQAAALDPTNPAMYAELGMAYRYVGDLENAERWLQAAAAFSGDNPMFLEMLALFYAEEAYNLPGGGLETLRRAVALAPGDADLRAGYGWALYLAGEVDAGWAELDRALTLDPANTRALYYRARILIDREQTGMAVLLLRRVAREPLAPFAVEARNLLDQLEQAAPLN